MASWGLRCGDCGSHLDRRFFFPFSFPLPVSRYFYVPIYALRKFCTVWDRGGNEMKAEMNMLPYPQDTWIKEGSHRVSWFFYFSAATLCIHNAIRSDLRF